MYLIALVSEKLATWEGADCDKSSNALVRRGVTQL